MTREDLGMTCHVKRFWLFSGYDYYPDGGAIDLDGTFDTLDEARAAVSDMADRWAHIFDVQQLRVVLVLNGPSEWREPKPWEIQRRSYT